MQGSARAFQEQSTMEDLNAWAGRAFKQGYLGFRDLTAEGNKLEKSMEYEMEPVFVKRSTGFA